MVAITTGDNGEDEDCELSVSDSNGYDIKQLTGSKGKTSGVTSFAIIPKSISPLIANSSYGNLSLVEPLQIRAKTLSKMGKMSLDRQSIISSIITTLSEAATVAEVKVLSKLNQPLTRRGDDENQVQSNKRMDLVSLETETSREKRNKKKKKLSCRLSAPTLKLANQLAQPPTTTTNITTYPGDTFLSTNSSLEAVKRKQAQQASIITPTTTTTTTVCASTMTNELIVKQNQSSCSRSGIQSNKQRTKQRRKQQLQVVEKQQLVEGGCENKPIGFHRSENGSGFTATKQQQQEEVRRRRKRRVEVEKVSGEQQPEVLVEQEKFNIKRKKNRRVLSVCGSSTKSTSLIMCWPSWRQLIVLSFLTILMTTLLTNFNIIKPSGSSCRLFNHCHALSVVQQPQQVSSPPLIASTAAGSGGQPLLPVLPSAAPSPAPNQLQQQQQQSALQTTGSTTSTTRPKQSPTSAAGYLLHAAASTTTATTATLSAPLITSNVSSSSSTAASQPMASHVDLHVNATPLIEASNKVGLVAPSPSPAPTSPSSSSTSPAQVQKSNYQKSRGNKSSGWTEVGLANNQQVDSSQQQQQQKIAYPMNTQYHTILSSSEDSTSTNEENNNNGQQILLHHSSTTNKPSSSITRNASESRTTTASGQQQPGNRVQQESTNRRTAQVAEEREGNIISSSIASTAAAGSRIQHQVPISPLQSSNQAIKVVEAPSFSTLTSRSEFTASGGHKLYPNGSFDSVAASTNSVRHPAQVTNPTSSPSHSANTRQQQQQQTTSVPNGESQQPSTWHSEGLIQPANEPIASSALNISITNEPLRSFADNFVPPPPIEATRFNQIAYQAADPMKMNSRYRFQAQQVPSGNTPQTQMIGLSNLPQELLHSFVHLNELIPHEPIFSAASATQPLAILRPQSLISALTANHQPAMAQLMASGLPAFGYRQQLMSSLNNQQQVATPGKQNSQIKHQTSASASAPSISLPPLSHLLVPRNPFRLFSSSSAPIATRYRPSLLGGSKGSSSKNINQQNGASGNKNKQQQLMWSATQQNQQHQKISPFQGMAQSLALDQEPTRLYAHSHSAEQLEKLVRAASQATGIHTPILPAIVSAPTGTIPGFYIPAIESESESQVNEMRHGESVGSITSKIPGTDYVLHPDEVRAMMSIGESAWQKQQAGTTAATAQQSQQSAQYQQSPMSSSQLSQSYAPLATNSQQQQQNNQQQDQIQQLASVSDIQQNFNFMNENHIQNARDFAYIEPGRTTRRDLNKHNSHLNSSLLESQLNHHFTQNNLNSFPAIIRVNDQDYVHWPLIKMGATGKPVAVPMDHQHHQQQEYTHLRPQHRGGSGGGSWSSTEESRQLLSLSPFQALYQAVTPPSVHSHLPQQLSRDVNSNQQIYGAYSSQHAQHSHSHNSRRFPQASNQIISPVPFQSNRLQPSETSSSNNNKNKESMMQKQETTHSNSQQSTQHHGSNANQLQDRKLNQLSQQANDQSDTDQSPVRLATQLTPSEIRQVEDSIIETLIVAQTLERQRKMMQQLAASLSHPVHVPRPTMLSSNNQNININNKEEQSSASGGGGKSGSGGRRVSSMFKNGFFGRRWRRNSTAKKQQQLKQQEEEKQQQQQKQAQQQKLQQQLIKQQLLASSASAALPQRSPQHLHLVPLMATNLTNRGQLISFVDESAADEDELELDDDSSDTFEHKSSVANPRPRVLLADQETNKPFGSNSYRNDEEVDSIESRQLDGEATESRATYVQAPGIAESLDSSESASSARLMADLNHPLAETVFGSRVVRHRNTPTAVASTGIVREKQEKRLLANSAQTSSGSLDTSSSKPKPTHQYSFAGALLNRANLPKQQAKIADEGEEIESVSKQPSRSSADSSPYRNRVDVDWPAMTSDADYFPSGQHQDSSLAMNHALKPSRSSHKPRITTIDSNSNNKRDNINSLNEWSQPKTSSSALKNYVTSQLKLQFAQDYTAREGVPIYNNNVRAAGAIVKLTKPLVQQQQQHQVAQSRPAVDFADNGHRPVAEGLDDDQDETDEIDEASSTSSKIQFSDTSDLKPTKKNKSEKVLVLSPNKAEVSKVVLKKLPRPPIRTRIPSKSTDGNENKFPDSDASRSS